jgi:UDP-glucose 4-epimerase
MRRELAWQPEQSGLHRIIESAWRWHTTGVREHRSAS